MGQIPRSTERISSYTYCALHVPIIVHLLTLPIARMLIFSDSAILPTLFETVLFPEGSKLASKQ